MPLWESLLLSYVITVLVETAAALLWKVKARRDLVMILLINTITNITVNLLVFLVKLFAVSALIPFEIAAETVIWLSEALLFKKVLTNCPHPLIFSLTLNAASFAAGMFISFILF